MGGRGAASGFGSGASTGSGPRGAGGTFYDRTDKFKGMKLHEFENAIRDRKTEYIGLFDANGDLIVAGTSGRNGSVAIPTGHPEFSKAVTLTHNHPSDGGRGIGGTFSEADVANHAFLQMANHAPNLKQTRAVASGKGENTYIIQNGANADTRALYQMATRFKINNTLRKQGTKTLDAVRSVVALKYGKKLSSDEESSIWLGGIKRVWKDNTAKVGFDYIEVKKPRW